jgi:hypothetical protein
VFKQKHGLEESLHLVTMNAICVGDVETLVKRGFDRATSQMICNTIRAKAREIGVSDLVKYHKDAKENGWSNIINRIVREQNKVYFASRANLEACKLLEYLDAPAVDTPSQIFKAIIDGRIGAEHTLLEDFLDDDQLAQLKDPNNREVCKTLMDFIDAVLAPDHVNVYTEDARKDLMESCEFFYRSEDSKPYTKLTESFNKVWRSNVKRNNRRQANNGWHYSGSHRSG